MIEPNYAIEAQEEFLYPGHLACQGCGSTIAIRYVLKALGKNTAVGLKNHSTYCNNMTI